MKTKKLLALLLAAVMLLGLLPVTAGAEGDVSLRTVPNDIPDANFMVTYEAENYTGDKVFSVMPFDMDES